MRDCAVTMETPLTPKRTILPRWLLIMLTVGFALSLFLVASFAFLTVRAIATRPLNPVRAGDDIDYLNVPLPAALQPIDDADLPDPPLLPTIDVQALEEEDQDFGRITVLAMGIDRRPGEGFVKLTDTMIVGAIDTETDSASVLSIPRDLYVDIPEHGFDRINTAFIYGARDGGLEGGAERAQATVSNVIGSPVEHYVIFDFSAVIQLIDTVGGVTVDVKEAINDPLYPDMNYGYDPFILPAGVQTLDGATALKYMRTRYGGTDFDRSVRQQQTILAFRDQVLAQGIRQTLANLPIMLQQVSDGIYTDLSLAEIVGLANAAVKIEDEAIDKEVLDYSYVSAFTTPGGASVLILNEETAVPRLQQLFP